MYIKLAELLANYHSTDPHQQECKQKMLEFLSSSSNCFSRENKVGHFTASAFVINKQSDKFLLMHHAKLDKWLQLGGHCDGDPDILSVAIKEAQEESGCREIRPISAEVFDLDIHSIPVIANIASHLHYDVRFLLQIGDDSMIKPNKESKDLKWFSVKDLLPTKSTSILRMKEKWRSNATAFTII
jgi:8-oxo-dGTP pyrophosphatase MutT (NUDIX family)